MRPAILSLLVLLLVSAASAGDIRQAKVSHKNGVYTLELEMRLASPVEAVYAIVTDYDQLHRISEVLIETSVLSEAGAEIKRRRLVTRTCILVFCFTSKLVEDVWETEHSIITRIVPGQSDYKYGRTEWRVNALDAGHSSIQLYCELQPAFWIPPFIGPYLMKKTMLNEAKKTIIRIEELSNNA